MWTARRLLRLLFLCSLFPAAYIGYVHWLGAIDGLPPLPEAYWYRDIPPLPPPPTNPPLLVKRFELAFGPDCKEARRPIRVEVPARGLLLSADHFTIEHGKVKLEPLSVALFSKNSSPERTPEINTIRGDKAVLTFEKPITTAADMGRYRIVAGQIEGNVLLINNRRTLARDDDLTVDVGVGPLYFDQSRQLIWTDDFVRLQDNQSKPRPTEISGQGMEVHLVSEEPAQRPGMPRRKSGLQNISGARLARLRSAVDMHLYVDGGSGFLSGGPNRKTAEARVSDPKKPAEKAHIIIKTQGPFSYDLTRDVAVFEVPAEDPKRPPALPEHVTVVRHHEKINRFDQLVCERLELQMKRKDSNKPGTPPERAANNSPTSPTQSLQIEKAEARGRVVTLTSDTEMLEAHGNHFTYEASAQRTTLRGQPQMWALKEGNEIHARELQIQETKNGQDAVAIGPGYMSLFDKKTGKRPLYARWEKLLTTTREGNCDVIHLTGKASFRDTTNDQDLQGDDLKVWLESVPQLAPQGQPAPAQTSRRPKLVEARHQVKATSRDYNIHDADKLTVYFKDAQPGPVPSPAAAPARGEKDGPVIPAPVAAAPAKPAAQAENKTPVNLKAQAVEIHVQRAGEKNELQLLKAAGGVIVRQASSVAGQKGTEVTGDRLVLKHRPEGDELTVTGDQVKGDLARLENDKTSLEGPEVVIDQAADRAWVTGLGSMTLETDVDFQGNKLKQPRPLTIIWKESMLFDGKSADFRGDVKAVQTDARVPRNESRVELGSPRLACQALQVIFDRPVSLRQRPGASKEKARVRNLLCDRSVVIEDEVTENRKLVKYQRLEGTEVSVDNEDEVVNATGPGTVRIVQPGSPEGDPLAPNTGRRKKDDDGLKLTYVQYGQRMYANRKTHVAVFYTSVKALYMPCDNPYVEVDLDRLVEKALPEGAMLMKCDQMKVYSQLEDREKKLKGAQELEATGRVTVEAREFSGKAERVTYVQDKDQIIFDGGEGGVATLVKFRGNGRGRQVIEGQKIIYSRKSGEHSGVKIRVIEGS